VETEKKRIKEWYPKHRLYYCDGEPFKEKQRYDSLGCNGGEIARTPVVDALAASLPPTA